MKKKNAMPVAMGVGFIWFTSQFGGGFASGAQVYQYFINFGIWCLITPIIAQLFQAIFQWYALKYAFNNKTFNYRQFTDSFYGKYHIVFSNLYEIVYLLLICLAPSIAFATGGSTLNELLGIPYIVCTLIIGVFIFVLSICGVDLVRRAATIVSYVLILGILIVFIPNIFVQWPDIVHSIFSLSVGHMAIGSKETGGFGMALWFALLYGAYHIASIGLYVQHAHAFTEEKESKKSMVFGFIVNSVVIFITTIGLLAVAMDPKLKDVSVPTLLFVQRGVGATFFAPIVSLLIIIGSVFSAVNMITGLVNRVVSGIEKKENEKTAYKHRKMRVCLVALICVIVTFSIAQFGLIPLVKFGYSYLGYVTIAVVVIPFIIHMVASKLKSKTVV